jgi:hypothetical protein
MRMHIVSTLWETSAVSVIQDSLEMDTTAQMLMSVWRKVYAIPWLPVQTLRVVLSASACQDTVEMAMNVQILMSVLC